MIVAATDAKLLVVVVDPRADRARRGEVERRAAHRSQLARGNARRVDRREARRVDRQLVVEHIAAIVAGEIEVRVLREGRRRRGIRRRGVVDDRARCRRSRV